MARCAEHAECYDDMTTYMKAAVTLQASLNNEERNMLSVAYKQAVGARRSALRVVQSASGKDVDADVQAEIATYTRKLQEELQGLCTDVIQLVKILVVSAAELEERVYYMKMEGDYNRYLAEFCPSSGAKEAA